MYFYIGERIQWGDGDDKMVGVIERCWKGSPEEKKSEHYGLAKFLVRFEGKHKGQSTWLYDTSMKKILFFYYIFEHLKADYICCNITSIGHIFS